MPNQSNTSAANSSSRSQASDVTLDAIARLLDSKIKPLQESQSLFSAQMQEFQTQVQTKFGMHEQRFTQIETHMQSLPSSSVDDEARANISRVEQQLKLLSISIAEGSRSTPPTTNAASRESRDHYVSDEQALKIISGGFSKRPIRTIVHNLDE